MEQYADCYHYAHISKLDSNQCYVELSTVHCVITALGMQTSVVRQLPISTNLGLHKQLLVANTRSAAEHTHCQLRNISDRTDTT